MSVVWHDIECGPYREDLPLWHELADRGGGEILDIGAGTGRVTLSLARAGHKVTALEQDQELLAELRRRADGLPVETVLGDARDFTLERSFALCLVPMQTIQLFGGAAGRGAFLRCARRHLGAGRMLAVAIAEELHPFVPAAGIPLPLPDIQELDGTVYSSQPTAVRAHAGGYRLERRREVVDTAGSHSVSDDAVDLDRLSAEELEAEGEAAGLRPAGRASIPETPEYSSSTVVILRA